MAHTQDAYDRKFTFPETLDLLREWKRERRIIEFDISSARTVVRVPVAVKEVGEVVLELSVTDPATKLPLPGCEITLTINGATYHYDKEGGKQMLTIDLDKTTIYLTDQRRTPSR
jgi:hypothetical protein